MRAYTFTVNNWDDMDVASIMEMCEDTEVRYCICGFEVGDSGTPHIQGYVYFKHHTVFDTVKFWIYKGHIEIAKGNPDQNYTYCSKDGDYWVFGILPQKGKATWDTIKDAMDNPKTNPHVVMQYRKTFDYIKQRESSPRLERLYEQERNSVEHMNTLIEYQELGWTICTDVETYIDEDVLVVSDNFFVDKTNILLRTKYSVENTKRL